jgi:ABC-2 type transport system ATP-binding protein
VVDHGRIIAEGTADSLKSSVGGERIEVIVHSPAELARAAEVLRRAESGELHIDEDERRITIPTNQGVQSLIQIGRALEEAGVTIDDLGLRRPTLDDVFLALTGHGPVSVEVMEDGASADHGRKA